MKRRIVSLLLALSLAFVPAGCRGGEEGSAGQESRLTIVTTTYPVYLFARAVTDGVEGVAVQRLDTGSVSCLHDYTLTVDDMKKIEGADVIALSGAGLEDFMDDALAASDAQTVDCSQGVELLENLSHNHAEGDEDGHDHGHWDPHIWMDPANARIMVENLADVLAQADPEYGERYRENGTAAAEQLDAWEGALREQLEGTKAAGLITFHDGFQYFARAFDLPLLAAIEEEAGSEASAKEIVEITHLVQENGIPVIFTEVNGSDATAQAIARETGCAVSQLTMLMDGPEDGGLDAYYDGMLSNITAVVSGFTGEEVVVP